jgi:hypothetical protein
MKVAARMLPWVRAYGVRVCAENQQFNTLMRQPTREAGDIARELLAAERRGAGAPAASGKSQPRGPYQLGDDPAQEVRTPPDRDRSRRHAVTGA